MRVQILDLDGSVVEQNTLRSRFQPTLIAAQDWGPRIRLACRFRRFRHFETELERRFAGTRQTGAAVTFYGSGDFHHVSLALLRRIKTPVNLLVIDNHPDWMRGVPFLHCGTWVNHAARLPQVQRIFHVGGDVDFDNSYRWLAPWRFLKEGKIIVLPGIRSFERGAWSLIPNKPVRPAADQPATASRLQELLWLVRADLARYPLYISLDKDVMQASEAVVNWDSGRLTLAEIRLLLHAFLEKARGNLIGMDIVGDWSRVTIRGWLGRVFHWTMHPPLPINAEQAALRNEQTNLALLDTIEVCWGRPLGKSA
jgi:hypothetical protein